MMASALDISACLYITVSLVTILTQEIYVILLNMFVNRFFVFYSRLTKEPIIGSGLFKK